MAAAGQSTMSGAQALDGVLKKLPERVARNVVRRAVTKGAKVIEEEMRARAPGGAGTSRRRPAASGSP